MQSTRKLAMVACVAATTLAIPAPSAGSQYGQAHRGDPSVRLSVSPHRANSGPELRLTMDEGDLVEDGVLDGFANTGSARLTTDVVTRHEGEAVRTANPFDEWATRLPAFDSTSAAPRAVIRVRNKSRRHDPLSPDRRSFRFGVDFALDEVSDGSSLDNGDNLVQRGLYQSRRQYKLQVDHRVVTCRVKGAKRALLVRSADKVEPLTWYRTRCSRAGGKLALKVWEVTDAGLTLFSSASRRGHTGSVTMARTTPLSIGGKLTGKSKIPGASDQFNGVLDEVVYDVGG
jgi:hypothetical protein